MLLVLFGCGATGPKFTSFNNPESNQGVIYVYRPSAFVNGGMAPTVYLNEQEKPKLRNGGYQVYNLPPGQYKIVTDGNLLTWSPGRSEVVVNLHAGEIVYIRLGSHVDAVYVNAGIAITDANLVPVKEELAKQELPETNLSM
jgi:hypothetical protein